MKKHVGSTLDSLFEELGEKDEIELLAAKKTIADALKGRMAELAVTSSQLAMKMKTSRNQVQRLLDPHETGITFRSLKRASGALRLSFAVKLAKLPLPGKTKAATRSPHRGKTIRTK